MPHLSPMTWLILPLFVWIILITMSSLFWFSNTPTFPLCDTTNNVSDSPKWHWF